MLQILVRFRNQVSDGMAVYLVQDPTVDDLFHITKLTQAVALKYTDRQQLMMRGEKFDYTFNVSDLEALHAHITKEDK